MIKRFFKSLLEYQSAIDWVIDLSLLAIGLQSVTPAVSGGVIILLVASKWQRKWAHKDFKKELEQFKKNP